MQITNINIKNIFILISIVFSQLIYSIPILAFNYQDLKLIFAAIFLFIYLIIFNIDIKLFKKSIIIISYLLFEIVFTTINGGWNYMAYHNFLVIVVSYMLAIYIIQIDDPEKIISTSLIVTALLIILGYIINLLGYIQLNDITGNKNISGAILLISIIFSEYVLKNKLRIFYIILVSLSILFLLKNRIPSLILMAILFFYIFRHIKSQFKIPIVIVIALFFVSLVAYRIETFELLINRDLYIRIFGWHRIIDLVYDNNFFLGYGLGELPLIYGNKSYIHPYLSIMTGSDIFAFSHNYLLDRLIYGGVLSLIFALSVNIFIFYKIYLNRKIKRSQPFFLGHIVLTLMMMYDITSNYYSTMLYIMIISIYILNLNRLVDKS